jgi:hypothetical protein
MTTNGRVVTTAEGLRRVRVLIDRDAASPREDDNVGTMACWHRRYTLGDVQPKDAPTEYLAALPAGSLILPLYLYDHSGITIRTHAFACPWDSGQVGVIHVSPERIQAEWGEGPEARDKATAYLMGEVATYDLYLTGQTYGFIIERGVVCDQGHTHWEHEDSCFGFLGSDVDHNGMVEHISDEALVSALREAMQTPEGW